ncbi:MAG: FHA domain-containing protein [Bacteroidales bacterium]
MKRFGRCRLDVSTRQFFRDELEVHLSPKAYELLTLLIENRPAVMSKGELHEKIWPETFVSDASLARLVTEIRHALGDEQSRSGVIRTVHGFGYAFAADVEETDERSGIRLVQDPASELANWLIVGTRTVPLVEGDNLIGRDPLAAIHLDWPSVSRRHARIRIAHGQATIEDLKSRNGTYVGGRRVTTAALADGDEIKVASVEMVFRQSRVVRTITDLP